VPKIKIKSNVFFQIYLAIGLFFTFDLSSEEIKDFSIEVDYSIYLSTHIQNLIYNLIPKFEIYKAKDLDPIIIKLYEFKTFMPWRPFMAYQTPTAVIGDFNGDNKLHLVVSGRNPKEKITVALITEKDNYQILEVWKSPLVENENSIFHHLTLITPTKISENKKFNRTEINLKTDAFVINFFEKSSTIYVYDGNKFISYQMSD
jgi:hypothetical protein